jgi:hypothetical protein
VRFEKYKIDILMTKGEKMNTNISCEDGEKMNTKGI